MTQLLCSLLLSTALSQTNIQGHFKSLPKTGFRIVYNQNSLNQFEGIKLAEGETDDKGEFSSSFLISGESPVMLFIDRLFLRLWVIPNTTLSIHETAGNTYTFSGQSSKHNEFLYQSGIMLPSQRTMATKFFEAEKQTRYLDSVEKRRWDLFERDMDRNVVSNRFKEFFKGEIKYSSFYAKNQYPLRFIYMEKTLKREDIPSNYYDFWNQFQLLDDSCSSDAYQNSVRDYVEFNATKALNYVVDDRQKLYTTIFEVLDSLLSAHPYTKEKQKAEALSFLIDYLDLPQLIQLELLKFKEEFPTSTALTFIQEKWDKKNKNAFTIPEFNLKDATGKIFDIKSLRGKVVYIDFWGSWCKPCLAQMPNSEIMQNKYKGKDVAFLFIDFYDSGEKWLKTIKDRKLRGIHVKAEKEDEKYFEDIFGIKNGFPRYALLDKNGVLITTSAPHPNDEAAIVLLDKYLN